MAPKEAPKGKKKKKTKEELAEEQRLAEEAARLAEEGACVRFTTRQRGAWNGEGPVLCGLALWIQAQPVE